MTIAIIHSDSTTTLKIIFSDTEHAALQPSSAVDFLHTANVSIDDNEQFKQHVFELLQHVKIQPTTA